VAVYCLTLPIAEIMKITVRSIPETLF